jgi:hypothetical protein
MIFISSLCNLGVLCVSVVVVFKNSDPQTEHTGCTEKNFE